MSSRRVYRKHPAESGGTIPRDDEIAHFPCSVAAIASLLALILAFIGAPRLKVLQLQLEWRVPHQLEATPSLALPYGENELLVVCDTSLKIMRKHDDGFRRHGAYFVETHRASLLGRTRILKGRRITKGKAWTNGATLVTESGVIIGVSIDEHDAQVIWENSFDGLYIEAIATSAPSDNNNNTLIILLARSSIVSGPATERMLYVLSSRNGNVLWSIDKLGSSDRPINRTNHLPLEIESHFSTLPVRNGESTILPLEGPLYAISWSWGAALLQLDVRGIVRILAHSPAIGFEHSDARVDVDGDGLFEALHVQFGQGDTPCFHLSGRKSTWKAAFTHSNCTNDQMKALSPSTSLANIVILKREKIKGGATILHGNLTVTRMSARGYNIVVLNVLTGQVSSIQADGTAKWSTSAVRPSSKSHGIRLWVLNLSNDKSDDTLLLSAEGVESTSYLLIMGDDQATVLRGSDGVIVSRLDFGSAVLAEPVLETNKAIFLLENGEIVRVNLRPFREFVPPLLLIPVMILLCSFWACVAWGRFGDDV